MPALTESVTTRNGVEQLRRRWPAEGTAKAAMLIVHGVAEHSGRYDHTASHFAAHDVDVMAFDLRGHGETEGRRGHVASFDELLDDVEDLLQERRTLGVTTILLGHSLGGLISAAYAVSDRPQPDLLVLSAPALAANVPGWQKALAPIISLLLPTLTMPADFDGELLSRDPDVGEAYRTDPLRLKKVTARLGAEIFATMDKVAADRSKIRVPTYVLHGSDDRLVPTAASEPLGDVQGVTRVVHDGLRHECLNEPDRDDVLAGIDAWLAEQADVTATSERRPSGR